GVEPAYTEEFWAITRHADVVEVSRKFQTFSSAKKGSLMNEAPTEIDNDSARLMIDLDPPDHTRLRTLVSRGFTPKAMRMLESHFRDVAIQLIEEAIEAGSVDFVDKVSAELPLIAIAELVGIPVEDRRKVFDWSNAMIGANDPEYAVDSDAGMQAATELYMYSNQLALERKANPKDDIITTLLSADVDGEKLSEDEFDMFFLLLSVAGNETTRNSITRGMMGFFDFPDQWEKYKSDPARYEETMVDEVVRWATPVLHFRRQCTQDYELNGVQMKAGDKVVLWHIAANRDPRAFDDPWNFDIERTPNDHVGFGGGGPHFCLGANLARMEIKLMFREIAKRLPDIHLAGDVAYLRSNFIGGVKKLPVAFTPTPSLNTVPMERLGSAAGASGT
ncbi:MAG: cytochrome P450, partial [Actinobacteria bacterium]|nr:cytochrome P450 [Actinomycetota bacterium]